MGGFSEPSDPWGHLCFGGNEMDKILKLEYINEEIDKFKEFATVLQSEGWELGNILSILQSYLKSKFKE